MNVREAAYEVVDQLKVSEPAFSFDISWILILIEIISAIIPVIGDQCDKPASEIPELAASCLHPTSAGDRIAYWWINRVAGRSVGWRNYDMVGGKKLLNPMMAKASSVSPEDMEELADSLVLYKE